MFDTFVAFHARLRPRTLAVITPQRRATYAEFDADVNRYAAALQGLGVGPDRGVVSLEVAAAYRRLAMFVALGRLGVPVSTARDDRADLRISDRPGQSGETVLRLSRAWISQVEASPITEVPSAARDPEDLARVMLSSGTTSTPRRTAITWRQIEQHGFNALAAYAGGRLGVWVIRTGLDSSLGHSLATLAWSMGATVAADFLARDLPGLLERHPAGLIGLTPIQLRETLAVLPPGFALKPDWRIVITGAALAPVLAREARLRLTPDIWVNYASTETGRATIGPASRLETTPGAHGWPVPGVTIEVVGPDGEVLQDGESGEIRIRSPRTAAGRYVDHTAESASAYRDGFFHPGDVGRRLADGSFVIEGRIDDRMNIGGVKLLPNILEDALLEHAQVKDAAAFAMPDASGVEECWMAVVVEGEVSRESLLAHLKLSRQRLPPIRFAWTETIPRNEMGKIDRAALRTQTAAALAKGEG